MAQSAQQSASLQVKAKVTALPFLRFYINRMSLYILIEFHRTFPEGQKKNGIQGFVIIIPLKLLLNKIYFQQFSD